MKKIYPFKVNLKINKDVEDIFPLEEFLHACQFDKVFKSISKDIEVKFIDYKSYKGNELMVGLAIGTQKNHIPPVRNSLAGSTKPLNLTEDEGLGYASVFLFDLTNHILLYEFNSKGAWSQSFIDFLNSINPIKGHAISIESILVKDAYTTIKRFSNIKRIGMKVHLPTFLQNRMRGRLPFSQIFENGDALSYDVVNLEFGTNLRSDFLNEAAVYKELFQLLQKDGIEKLEITGYDSVEEKRRDAVDLITQRLYYEMSLKEDRIISDFSIHERKSNIFAIYKRNFVELQELI